MAEQITKQEAEDLVAKAIERLRAEREAEKKGAESPVDTTMEMKQPTKLAAVDTTAAAEKTFPAVHTTAVKDKDAAKSFSIAKAIGGVWTGDWSQAGLEREMIKDMAQNVRYKTLGLLPDTAGGFLVPEEVSSELIGMLEAETVFRRAGAMVIPNAPLTLRIPRQTQNTTAYWVGDAPLAAAVTASDPAFGMMTLQPRRVAARTVLDEDLIAHSMTSAESIVRADITGTIGRAQDLAYYSGTGGNQPLGLVDQPGVTITGVASAAFSFDSILDAMTRIEAADGKYNAILMHPTRMNAVRQLKTGIDTYHHILDVGTATRWQIFGLPVYTSTQLNTAHIIIGNFPSYAIADSGPLAIKVLREAYADQLQIGIVASHRTDGAPRQAAEFQIINIT